MSPEDAQSSVWGREEWAGVGCAGRSLRGDARPEVTRIRGLVGRTGVLHSWCWDNQLAVDGLHLAFPME